MTTLEYMKKQLQKHIMNYERESSRGVSNEILQNIKNKIGYYKEVVSILEKEE